MSSKGLTQADLKARGIVKDDTYCHDGDPQCDACPNAQAQACVAACKAESKRAAKAHKPTTPKPLVDCAPEALRNKVQELFVIDGVEAVYLDTWQGITTVRCIVDEFSNTPYFKLNRAEHFLTRAFPQSEFAFQVRALQGRDLDEVKSGERVV